VRGLECAFWGTLGKASELKTSKNGKAFANMNVVVSVGQSDDNKDVSQWIRVACFGATAENIAARTKKSDRIYVEGSLTMTQWNAADGEVKHGLNVAAWKCGRLGNIGKHRPCKEPEPRATAPRPAGSSKEVSASYRAGPAGPRPFESLDGFDFERGDPLPL
jgi:single stranded DNA-binding protein